MPETVNMVPLNTIILSRVVDGPDGKKTTRRVVPEIGKIFAFLPSEIDQIEAASPTYQVLRKPRSDSTGRPEVANVDMAALQKVAPPIAPGAPVAPVRPSEASGAAPTTAAAAKAASVAATPKKAPAAAAEPEEEEHGL